MNFPAWLVLALVLSLAISLTYELVTGRTGRRIAFHWLLVFIGFMGAELFVEALGWSFTRVGDLRIGADVAGALIAVACLEVLRW